MLKMLYTLKDKRLFAWLTRQKNWLFSNTANRAKASAALYSLISTAQANGLDAEKYLTELLSKPAGTILLPWAEESWGRIQYDQVCKQKSQIHRWMNMTLQGQWSLAGSDFFRVECGGFDGYYHFNCYFCILFLFTSIPTGLSVFSSKYSSQTHQWYSCLGRVAHVI